jgi:hypothetical protein
MRQGSNPTLMGAVLTTVYKSRGVGTKENDCYLNSLKTSKEIRL